MIPACTLVNGKVYRDYEDIGCEEFLKLIEEGAVPTSSQPAIGEVMEIFEDTGAWNLPVVNEQKQYLGFVSKSKIFNSYRHVLVHFSEE